MKLNRQALETLRLNGITPQQWKAFHLGEPGDRGPWSPHEPGKACWCIDVMFIEYLAAAEGDRWRRLLTPLAGEPLTRTGIRLLPWARFHFDVTNLWWGAGCGCPDHHCNPCHHDNEFTCACLPGLIEQYLKYGGDPAKRSDAYETWNAELARLYAIWDEQANGGTDD